MADDLFQRYMKAFRASNAHTDGCAACQNGQSCRTGAPLHERFARLQDAYVTRQRNRR